MNNIHQVSPCCGVSSRKFGGRRRQCRVCKKTWRLYQHRRGRKYRRVSRILMRRVILNGRVIEPRVDHREHTSPRGLRKRFERALEVSLRPPVAVPRLRGSYILIADGLWYRFNGEEWVLYMLLLKPRHRNSALLIDPVMLKGRELFNNWDTALQTIPAPVRTHIVAFVSDHFSASEKVAAAFGWIHQLCHFHLIAELQRRRGRRKRHLPGSMLREAVYQCVLRLLQGGDARVERRLRQLIGASDCPRKVSMIAREFLRVKERYHAYLRYPLLNLPTTTGAAESLGKLIRKRTWPLRTPDAVLRWATAYTRLKKNLVCNSVHAIIKKSTKLSS